MADKISDYEVERYGGHTMYTLEFADGRVGITVSAWEDFSPDVTFSKAKWDIVFDGYSPEDIEIGCESKAVEGWDEFFRDRQFFTTNPDEKPKEYAKIVETYKFAVKWLRENDLKDFEHLGT